MGASYKFNEYFSSSLVQRNILHFAEEKFSTAENSNFEEDVKFAMPYYLTLGFAYKRSINLYIDNEFIFGNYGGKELKHMEFWILKVGLEKIISKQFTIRFGLANPIIAKASSLGDIRSKLPFPKCNISTGLGYSLKHFSIDLAIFLNPGLSYVQRKPVPAVYFSGTYRY